MYKYADVATGNAVIEVQFISLTISKPYSEPYWVLGILGTETHPRHALSQTGQTRAIAGFPSQRGKL